MAMAPSLSTGGAAKFGSCQRRRTRQQLCVFPLHSALFLLPRRGGGRLLPPDSPASRGLGIGRGVKWKERARVEASGAPALDEARHRCRGMTTAAASTNGGSREPLPPGAVTFSATISTDLPLHDSPEASFDQYLDDRPRIFGAMFPDSSRCRRLNDEEWRVQMLPIQFLFASVNPVIVMRLRCSSDGRRYPAEAPPHVARVLELRVTRWELQGLDGAHMPPHFALDVRGLLYPDRGEGGAAQRSRLKGHLEMSITMVLPPVLALVPEQVLSGVAESVLRTLLERMKQEVDGSLLADFQSFRRERLNKQLVREMVVAQQPPVHGDPDARADS